MREQHSEVKSARDFLGCRTPEAWLALAVQQQQPLLLDHAHCEKKAAATAVNLLFRYPDRPELLMKLAQLAREELLHFEQVLDLLKNRNIPYGHLVASRYASQLRASIRTQEPARLIDTLIVCAFIEARSCERFACLAPLFLASDLTQEVELGRYYRFLLQSEERHFLDYLALARLYVKTSKEDFKTLETRIEFFRDIERDLILTPDPVFRFHSGVPL